MDSRWNVAALHHGYKETRLTSGVAGEKISVINEGIPWKAIEAGFTAQGIAAVKENR
jgi:hypothetical protein